jgi:hypothetical protein
MQQLRQQLLHLPTSGSDNAAATATATATKDTEAEKKARDQQRKERQKQRKEAADKKTAASVQKLKDSSTKREQKLAATGITSEVKKTIILPSTVTVHGATYIQGKPANDSGVIAYWFNKYPDYTRHHFTIGERVDDIFHPTFRTGALIKS